MRKLLLFSALFLSTFVQAQISGRVTNAATGEGIPYASLSWLDQPGGATADAEGDFILAASQLPQRLIISSLNYRTDTLLITRLTYLEVRLTAANAQLPEVSVTADRVWEVINKDKVFPLDFAVCQNRLFVLGQRGIGNNFHLASYSAAGEMQFERELTIGKVIGLETNCFDQLVLKTREFAIRLDASRLEPVEKTPYEDYKKLFADCQASTDKYVYLERKYFEGFRKLYIVGERGGGDIGLFQAVWYREMARRTAAFLRIPPLELNIGKVSTPTQNKRGRRAQADYDFAKAITFKNHNDNSLFLDEDRVVLFNFDHDAIEHFSLAGDSLSTVEIAFNNEKNPDDAPMVHDPITGKYYAIRRAKSGYALHEVDLTSGAIIREHPLNIARYNKLAVLDDRVYMVGVALRGRVSEYPRFMRMGL